jgi:hypothetical protein
MAEEGPRSPAPMPPPGPPPRPANRPRSAPDPDPARPRFYYLLPAVLTIAGGAAITLGILLLLRQRLPDGTAAPQTPTTTTADTAFRFEDAGWRNDKGTCIATIRVTAMGKSPRRLTLFVTDSSGAALGRDVKEAPVVAPGALVEFHFANLDCRRVDEWQVQGEFAKN